MHVSLAGRAAEEVFFGTRYNSVGGDFPAANRNARLIAMTMDDSLFLNPDNTMTEPQKRRTERILEEEYKRVKQLVAGHRD